MGKDKAADHFRTDRTATTPNRQGLTGAAPVGNRWRSQGYIDGSVKYLGTFDTEQEAHDCYVAAKKADEVMKTQAEEEWEATAPMYVYEGGIGRGARLNGTRYKLVSDDLPEHLILRQIGADGTIGKDLVTLNRRYLKLVEGTVEAPPAEDTGAFETGEVAVDPEEDLDTVVAALRAVEGVADGETLAGLPPKVAAALLAAKGLLVESTREAREAKAERDALKTKLTEVLFATGSRALGDKEGIRIWLLEHLIPGDSAEALKLVGGTLDHQAAAMFLKEHTMIPHSVIDEVLDETVGQVFTRPTDPDPSLVERVNSGRSRW
jgi:hypothetical protein